MSSTVRWYAGMTRVELVKEAVQRSCSA